MAFRLDTATPPGNAPMPPRMNRDIVDAFLNAAIAFVLLDRLNLLVFCAIVNQLDGPLLSFSRLQGGSKPSGVWGAAF